MKQLFLTGLLVGGALLSAQAQSGYDDDIYSSAPVAPARPSSGYSNSGNYNGNDGYSNQNSGNGSYNSGNYADDYDYIDYTDDYTYATRFRRFDAPFYNVGYFSGFWSPWSYNPYWGSPWYGGYNYGGWGGSGIYVSVGYGGPYWSSGWGYNTWYGYGGFSSYWGYPSYAGWGHPGGGYGWGYRNGYWDGYYAGLYGAGAGYAPYAYRRINYAPRTTIGGVNGTGYRAPFNSGNRALTTGSDNLRGNGRGQFGNDRQVSNNAASERAVRPSVDTRLPDRNNRDVTPSNGRVRDGQLGNGADRVVEAPAPSRNNTGRGGFFSNSNDRAVEVRPSESSDRIRTPRGGSFNNGADRMVDAPAPTRNGSDRGGWFNNDRSAEAPVRENTRPRGGFFGNSDRVIEQQAPPVRNNDGWQNQRAMPDRGYSAPRQIERREMPRFEQRMEAPRPQPRFEAPMQRMSPPSGGGISAPSGGRGGGGYRR